MASPFIFVSKKDGKLWPCQDYQYLNERTVKNAYPLPLLKYLRNCYSDFLMLTEVIQLLKYFHDITKVIYQDTKIPELQQH